MCHLFSLTLWWPLYASANFFVFLILMDQWVSWNSFVGKPAQFVRILVVRTIFIWQLFQRKVWCQRRHRNVLQEPKHRHLRLWKIRQLLISICWSLCFSLYSLITFHCAFCGEIGTNFLFFSEVIDILVFIRIFFPNGKPMILAPIGSFGMINFLARSSVYQAPLVPISYLPDSRPIKRSSSLVPVYSNL